MNEEVINIKNKFDNKIVEFYEKSKKRYYITIEKDDLLDFVDYIFNELGFRYMIETGIDTPGGIEILYHFSFDSRETVVTLKTLLDSKEPVVESISSIVPGAKWIEREIMDILGVKFLNHPNPEKFILSDDWNEKEYPLRRDYDEKKNNN
ncbi:MAG: NADH-quinone oxidoreductase subunit C [Candidatus Mcinerneyibacterium aminivorans]|uniref:NADH-quinone oxidoreductase subunit C n=1 Tax=Candidatus Mcinerneyibacterium aminivorans TaxID=2703815 RepID=A0A5D0MKI7_9BACT|nr:MAG: NADH-quinone oxidoreductase subunit C [Candidatus Mcinerneyibacterium aminivorans]